mgnify:CR=1 FL=1
MWFNFSALQQGMWMVDETEAQWVSNVDAASKHDALEVQWSKADSTPGANPFVDDCLAPIADFLGLRVAPSVFDHKSHTVPPSAEELAADELEIRDYRRIMRLGCDAYRILDEERPVGEPSALLHVMGGGLAPNDAASHATASAAGALLAVLAMLVAPALWRRLANRGRRVELM